MTAIMDNYALDEYCADLAEEILEDSTENKEDLIYQYADNSEYVIYYNKANNICQNCDVSAGEDYIDKIGEPEGGWTYHKLVSSKIFGEISARIANEISKRNV